MTNAQILIESLNTWITPIAERGLQNLANKNDITFLISNVISPNRLLKSIKDFVGVPYIHEYISKVPDNLIPDLALDLINGMIETRVEQGPLEIPFLGLKLNPDAFRNLKNICEQNFEQYKINNEQNPSS
jgi:hypothetical protein